jgi:hypothetical protein
MIVCFHNRNKVGDWLCRYSISLLRSIALKSPSYLERVSVDLAHAYQYYYLLVLLLCSHRFFFRAFRKGLIRKHNDAQEAWIKSLNKTDKINNIRILSKKFSSKERKVCCLYIYIYIFIFMFIYIFIYFSSRRGVAFWTWRGWPTKGMLLRWRWWGRCAPCRWALLVCILIRLMKSRLYFYLY